MVFFFLPGSNRLGLEGLSTELVIESARLAIRIEPGREILEALARLQNRTLAACADLADGAPVGESKILLDDDQDGSWLALEVGASPRAVFTIAAKLAHLDEALRTFGKLRRRHQYREELCYLIDETQQRCFHVDFWLFELEKVRPDLHERMLEAGIETDRAWLAHERELDGILRLELAHRRFDFGCRAAGIESKEHGLRMGPERRQRAADVMLTRVAALVPPWLSLSDPVLLEVVPGLRRIREAGIDDFAELSALDESALHKRVELQEEERRDLVLALREKVPGLFDDLLWRDIAGVPVTDPESVSLDDLSSLGHLVAWLLTQLAGEERHNMMDREELRNQQLVLAHRIGEPSIATFGSLQFVTTEIFGPSTQGGERARQVQLRAINSLKRSSAASGVLGQLQQSIEQYLAGEGSPLPMGRKCPIGALATQEPAAAERFLKLFFRDGRLPLFELTDDGSGLGRFGTSTALEIAVQEMLAVAQERPTTGRRSLERIMPHFEATMKRYPEVPSKAVEEAFFDTLNWTGEPPAGDCRLVSRGTTAAAIVVAVLAQAGRAMSRTELSDACSRPPFELKIKPASLGNVLSALIADPHNESNPDVFEAVFQLGHGIYACQADLPLDIESTQALSERAARLIREGRRSVRPHPVYGDAYQWHCADLVECLESKDEAGPLNDIDSQQRWYLLDASLRYHHPEGVVGLQKGFWMAQVPGLHLDDHQKVDQNEVVKWVLETWSDGKPMSIADIRDKVVQVQSLGAAAQLQIANQVPASCKAWVEKAGRGLLKLKPDQ